MKAVALALATLALASSSALAQALPLPAASVDALVGTRGSSPVLDVHAALPGRSTGDAAQALLGARFAFDTGTIEAHAGAQARPWRGETFALRLAGTAGPQLSIADGLAWGARVNLEAQGEARVGDFVFSAGPRVEGLAVVQTGAAGSVAQKLGVMGTLAVGWLPRDGLGVVVRAEGGSSISRFGSALAGALHAGVVLPLPTVR
jgi:hypothetical protein